MADGIAYYAIQHRMAINPVPLLHLLLQLPSVSVDLLDQRITQQHLDPFGKMQLQLRTCS